MDEDGMEKDIIVQIKQYMKLKMGKVLEKNIIMIKHIL